MRAVIMHRILLLDDEAVVTETLAPALSERLGAKVDVISSAEEALALLEREPYDIVISDFKLPGMDGAAFLRRLRSERPTLARVLITGHRDQAMAAIGGDQSLAHEVIRKPYSLHRMTKTLRRLLALQGRAQASGSSLPRGDAQHNAHNR